MKEQNSKSDQEASDTDAFIDEEVQNFGGHCSGEEKSQLRSIFVDILQNGLSIMEAIRIPPAELEFIYSYALGLYSERKYKEANTLFYYLVNMNQKDPRFTFAYAASFHKMEKYEEAAGFYMLTASMQPENPAPWFHMGDCYVQLGQFDVAHAMLLKSIHVAGTNPEYERLKNQAEAVDLSIQQSLVQK